ncbi:MAG TPA: hypothetical protein VM076_22345 [Gemmatimonadaceae bacterium]|nr:hypothetical protein [Gemmatimonadaceae bacterium]
MSHTIVRRDIRDSARLHRNGLDQPATTGYEGPKIPMRVRFGSQSAFLSYCQSELSVISVFVARSCRLVAPTLVLCSALVACYDDPVSPSPAPETAVSIAYCAAAAPTWVAFRDGDGGWTREMPATSGSRTTFRHAFTSDRAAMASLTPLFDTQFTVLRVLYGAPAEIATEGDTTQASCAVDARKTLRGTLAGLTEAQSATVNIGPFARTSVQPLLGLDFTVEGVLNGPQDLLATRTTHGTSPTRFILRRDVDLPNGSLIPTLDFESAEAFEAVKANVTIAKLGAEAAVNFTSLVTRHGAFTMPLVPGTVTTATRPYAAFPEVALRAGDLELLHVSTGGATVRTADVFFRLPVNRTVTLGDPITAPTVTAATSAALLRPRAQFAAQPDYDRLTYIVYEQPARPAFTAVSMTPAYAARIGGYDLDVPDLSPVPGFDSAWALGAGLTTTWNASRVGGTLPLGRNAVPVDGATRRSVTLQGTMTLP